MSSFRGPLQGGSGTRHIRQLHACSGCCLKAVVGQTHCHLLRQSAGSLLPMLQQPQLNQWSSDSMPHDHIHTQSVLKTVESCM